MLTPEDVKLMESVFATREEIVSRSEFFAMKRDIQTAIDGLAQLVRNFRDEHMVFHHRLERLENWAKKVAKKIGISLSF